MTAKMVNPTGRSIRGIDDFGSGSFGADRDGGTRKHCGLDLESCQKQWVVSPIYGFVSRLCKPYGDGKQGDSGVEIHGSGEHAGSTVKIFYLDPFPGILATTVKPRQIIGWATGLQERYPNITDHIHLELWEKGVRIDPEPFIEWAR